MTDHLKHLPVYPVASSLHEATEVAKTFLPITNDTDLRAVLGIYHNTFFAIYSQETNHANPNRLYLLSKPNSLAGRAAPSAPSPEDSSPQGSSHVCH